MGARRPITGGAENPAPETTPNPSPTAPVNPDLEWVLKEHYDRSDAYSKYRDYYKGKQSRMIADKQAKTTFGEKFKDFRINLCRPVVGALADRLQVGAFTSAEEEAQKRELEAMKREMEKKPALPTPEEEWGERTVADLQAQKATGGTSASPQSTTQGQGQTGTAGNAVPNPAGAVGPDPNQPAQNNLAPPPADAIDPELKDGEIAGLEAQLENVPTASEEAWEIWKRNRMYRRVGQIWQESIGVGDSYAIVWPNDEDLPVIYPHKAHEMCVSYDPDDPGKIEKAGKMWTEDITLDGRKKKGVRITLYYEDRIERWAAPRPDTGKGLKPDSFLPYTADPIKEPAVQPHTYERVPVFHFANDADIGEYGRSELADATPIQDWVNKSAFDILVAQEYHAVPQRWFLNVEDPRRTGGAKLETGSDRLWALRSAASSNEEPQAQIGQFQPGDLGGLTNILNQGAQAMAVTTGTPVHHFLPTLEGPATPASGESQKTSDVKLQQKVEDRQISFGDVLSELMSFAVRVQRGDSLENVVDLEVEWKDTRPRSEREEVLMSQDKQKAGVPWQRSLKELGYNDDEIAEFEHLKLQNQSTFAPAQGNVANPDVNDAVDQFAKAVGMDS